MPSYPQVRLLTDRISDHPWVFGSAMEEPKERIPNGTVVDLINQQGRFIARGHYNRRARVGLRVLTRDPEQAIDLEYFRRRIQRALSLRRFLKIDRKTNAFRLVHGEGDELSGLVIDIYNDVGVIQYYSHGMFRHRNDLQAILKQDLKLRDVYTFADTRVQKQESFDWKGGPANLATEIVENGVKFHIEFDVQHKTGFYLDQRNHRMALAELSADKSVLDICTFAGGFALAAKVAGHAADVTAIDLDPAAIALAEKNAQLNAAQVNFVTADLYQFLDQSEQNEKYDIVILDPAKLTAAKDKKESALNNYALMNRLAMKAVKRGGIFLTCSCTGLISEDEFLGMIRRSAFNADRNVQVFNVSGAGEDHPFLASATESRYLKAVWSRIL